jgi:hypothetical protein
MPNPTVPGQAGGAAERPTKEVQATNPYDYKPYQERETVYVVRRPKDYSPSFWENPSNVVKYKAFLDSIPPDIPPPDWLNPDYLNAAYDYLGYVNKGNSPDRWRYLRPEDPGRQFLQGLAVPPANFLNPAALMNPRTARQLQEQGDPAIMAMLQSIQDGTVDPSQLPRWQRTVANALGSPWLPVGMTGFTGGLIAAGVAGPIGAAIGGLGGAALGFVAYRDPEGSVAEWLNTLDLPAEGLEQVFGILDQLNAAQQDPEQYGSVGEVLGNLEASRRAASLTYTTQTDVGNVFQWLENFADLRSEAWARSGGKNASPMDVINYILDNRGELGKNLAGPGEAWQLGVPVPVELQGPQGRAAIVDARRRIMAGEDAQSVLDEYSFKYGFSGQFSELLFHVVLDPLNVAGESAGAVTGKLAQQLGNVPLAKAMLPAAEFADIAVPYRGIETALPLFGRGERPMRFMEGVQVYKNYLRTGAGEAPFAEDFTAFQRMLAGTGEAGIIREIDPSYVPPGKGNVVGNAWAYLTTLNPDAKAKVTIGIAHDNAGILLDMAGNDVQKMGNLINSWANNSPRQAAETARFLGAPEAQSVRAAIASFAPEANDMVDVWHMTETPRQLLHNMAEIHGSRAGDLLAMLADETQGPRVFNEIANKARGLDTEAAKLLTTLIDDGVITPDNAGQFFRVFRGDNPAALYPEEFRANLMAAMIEHSAEWAVKAFDVKEPLLAFRYADTLKKAQSLLLLGLNPAYLVGNQTNNMVTRAASGVFGYVDQGTISNWINRFGVEPYYMRAGIGAAEIGLDLTSDAARQGLTPADIAARARGGAEKVVRAAGEPPAGALKTVDESLGKLNKFGIAAVASQKFEKIESQQAFFIGMRQMMDRMWKSGQGASPMPPALADMLSDIDPRLPPLISGALEGALNNREIQAVLSTGAVRYNLEAHLNDLSRQMGMSPSDLKDTLGAVGAYDFIQERLPNAKTQSDLVNMFRDLDGVVQDHLDARVQADLLTRMEEVANRVSTSGYGEALRVYDDLQFLQVETYQRNFDDWHQVFEMTAGKEKAVKNQIVQAQKLKSNREWVRTNKFEQATYLGMFKAMGADSPSTRAFMSGIEARQTAWRDFFKFRDEQHRTFFDLDIVEPQARSNAWTQIQSELNQAAIQAYIRELEISTDIDMHFADVFAQRFGDDAADVVAVWRAEQTRFNSERGQLMLRHRAKVGKLSAADGRAEWNRFIQEDYMPFVREYYMREVEWAHDVHQAATGKVDQVRFRRELKPGYGGRPGRRPTAPAPETPITPDGIALLSKMESGGIPAFVSKQARQTFINNGIPEDVVARSTPNELITMLREKRDRFYGGDEPGDLLSYRAPEVPAQPLSPAEQRAMQVRRIAQDAEYGLPNLDASGKPIPGTEQMIRDLVLEYGSDDVRRLYHPATPLEEMRPDLVESAFARRAAKKQVVADAEAAARKAFEDIEVSDITPEFAPETAEQIDFRVQRDRLVSDLLNKPRHELDPHFNAAVLGEAQELLHELDAGRYVGLVDFVRPEDYAPYGSERVRMSENVQWYRDLFEDGFTSRDTMRNAIQRIIDDEGADAEGLRYVNRIKELIADRLLGEAESPLPPHPALLLEARGLDAAAEALGRWVKDGYAAPEDLLPANRVEEVVDRWLELASKQSAEAELPIHDGVDMEKLASGRDPGGLPEGLRPEEIAELRSYRQTIESQYMQGTARGGTAEEASAFFELLDRRAQAWAQENNRSPIEWYRTFIARFQDGTEGTFGPRLEQNPSRFGPWYSALEERVNAIGQKTMTAEQLQGFVGKGNVKADELKWTGFEDWLAGKGPTEKVTKAEALQFLRENRVELAEVTKGEGLTGYDYDTRRIETWNRLDELMPTFVQRLVDDGISRADADHQFFAIRTGEVQGALEGVPARGALGDLLGPREVLGDIFEEVNNAAEFLYRNNQEFETGGAKYETYTLPGGENYRELLMILPGQPDAARSAGVFSSPHWQEDNVLAHVRYKDRLDADGRRWLFLEEIQSDWHEQGRRQGYRQPQDLIAIADLQARSDQISLEVKSLRPESQEYLNAISLRRAIDQRATDLITERVVPDAPYKNTWSELAMRRMLFEAAQQGYDGIAWTKGATQIDRYNLSQHFDYIKAVPDGDGISLFGRRNGENIETRLVGGRTAEQLDDYVGVDIANNIRQQLSAGVEEARVDGDDLRVGGEGMLTFYDEFLVRNGNKLGKQWGVGVGEGQTIVSQGVPADYRVTQLDSGEWIAMGLDADPALRFPNQAAAEMYARKVGGMDPGGESIWQLPITDDMRTSIPSRGMPIFQDAKGATQFLDDGRAVITFFKGADISTSIHEVGHVFRRQLTGPELDAAAKLGGLENGDEFVRMQRLFDAGQLDAASTTRYRAAEENFARGFERYLAGDTAGMVASVRQLFEKFKTWLYDIYKRVRGSDIDVDIRTRVQTDAGPISLQDIFDDLLGVERANEQLQGRVQQATDNYKETIGLETWAKELEGEINAPAPYSGELPETATSLFQHPTGDEIRSKAFRDWFQKSMVVDEDGKPLVVYHGTTHDFQVFDPLYNEHFFTSSIDDVNANYSGQELGIGPSRIGQYTDTLLERFILGEQWELTAYAEDLATARKIDVQEARTLLLDAKQAKDLDSLRTLATDIAKQRVDPSDGLVMPVYLSMQNPLDVRASLDAPFEDLNLSQMDALIARAKAEGYDGVIMDAEAAFPGMRDTQAATHYIVFKSEQVKGVFNKGSFSRTDPNILYQDAPRGPIGPEFQLPPGEIPDRLGSGKDIDPVGPLPLGTVEGMASPKYEGMHQAQGMGDVIRPLLNGLLDNMLKSDPELELKFKLPPEGLDMMRNWGKQLEGDMATTKLAALRWGENRRNAALLPYHRRYGTDNLANIGYPYQFFFTRQPLQWAMRAIDRPAWFANYARIRNFTRNTVGVNNLPSRFRDKMKIPAPYLPEWAGDGVFVDPLRYLNPIEIGANPVDYYNRDQDALAYRAEQVIERWVNDGTIDRQQATQMKDSREGELWERAMEQAGEELGQETGSPMDFLNLILSPGLPWGILNNIIKGTPEKISVLPITRTGQAARVAFEDAPFPFNLLSGAGDLLAKPEEFIRQHAELSEFGEWGPYYVDRMLANMAAEGEYPVDEVLRAQISQSGEVYDEAYRRVQFEQALRTPGVLPVIAAASGEAEGGDLMAAVLFGWMPAGLFPEGELEQRGLKDVYDQAWRAYNNGNKQAISTFFDENPEYRARLALWDEPEDRLRQFMVNEIWGRYFEIPSPNRSLIANQMGEEFQTAFLNSETRSYESIDLQTMSFWAQRLGIPAPDSKLLPPDNLNSLLVQAGLLPTALNLMPNDVAQAVEDYRGQRDTDHPNWFALQQRYFSLQSRGEQQEFLRQFPDLADYWEDNREFKSANPQLIPILENFQYQQWHIEHNRQPISIEQDGWEAYLKAFWSWKDGNYGGSGSRSGGGGSRNRQTYSLPSGINKALQGKLMAYYGKRNGKLGFKARENLYKVWAASGYPAGDFNTWVDVVLRERFGKAGRKRTSGTARQTPVDFQFNPQEFRGSLSRHLVSYYLMDEELGPGASRSLRKIWSKHGEPSGDFYRWVNDYLRNDILSMAGAGV